MSLKEIEINDKIARIMIAKVNNGFIVGIFPENKELEDLMKNYMTQVMNAMQNAIDGEGWKTAMEEQINSALGLISNNRIQLHVCTNAIEVMNLIAPQPEKDAPSPGKLDLRWFWCNITNEN